MELTIIPRRLFLLGWHEWQPFYERDVHWNWIDIQLIVIRFEWADYVPRVELQFGLLGFHLELEYWRRERNEPGQDMNPPAPSKDGAR